MERSFIRISVRNLVEFIFRAGNIDNRISQQQNRNAMEAGSILHRKIQRRQGSNYKAEVSLKYQLQYEEYSLQLEGRADGIFSTEQGVFVDEIKGMFSDVTELQEPIYVHKAQAMCYAAIYLLQEDLNEIGAVSYTHLTLPTICSV